MKLCPPVFFGSCCAALALAISPGVLRADDKSRLQAQALLAEAAKFTDIRAIGSPPFHLKARFSTNEYKGPQYEGTYELEWNTPNSWKDEIKAASFSQVRVARGGHLFVSRTPDKPVPEVLGLLRLVDFPPYFDLNANLTVEKLSEKQNHGVSQRVIAVSIRERHWTKVYLDRSLARVDRIEIKGALFGSYYPYKDFESSTDFGDYRKFHDRQFPYRLSHQSSGGLRYQIEILELTDVSENHADFDPPSDAHWINWCAHPRVLKPKKNQVLLPPNPPPQFRAGAPRLHVMIYGVIGTDGRWHNLTVLKSEGETVDSYFLKNVTRLITEPPQCDGKPVESEQLLDFDYP